MYAFHYSSTQSGYESMKPSAQTHNRKLIQVDLLTELFSSPWDSYWRNQNNKFNNLLGEVWTPKSNTMML